MTSTCSSKSRMASTPSALVIGGQLQVLAGPVHQASVSLAVSSRADGWPRRSRIRNRSSSAYRRLVGALILDQVVHRQDDERRGRPPGRPVHADLALAIASSSAAWVSAASC